MPRGTFSSMRASGGSGSAPASPGTLVRVTPTLLFRNESLTHVGNELRDKFTVTNTAKDRITVNVFRTLRSYKYSLDIEPSTAKIKPVCDVPSSLQPFSLLSSSCA